MKKLSLFSVLVTSILLLACQNQYPILTDSKRAEIEKQVLEKWNNLISTVEKVDTANYPNFISSNEFIAMYFGGTAYLSREEFIKTIKNWFSQRKSNQLENRVVKVTILSSDLVIVDQTCIFQINFKDDRILRLNHALSFIMRREESDWKIIHGHESWNNI